MSLAIFLIHFSKLYDVLILFLVLYFLNKLILLGLVFLSNVRVSKVAVSHGSLTISIASNLSASQPGAFSGGTTAILPSTTTSVNEQKGGFKLVEEAPTIERVAAALNALGVSTRDMMSIFQTMKRAGALQAELVLN